MNRAEGEKTGAQNWDEWLLTPKQLMLTDNLDAHRRIYINYCSLLKLKLVDFATPRCAIQGQLVFIQQVPIIHFPHSLHDIFTSA